MKYQVKIGIETDGDFNLEDYDKLFSMNHPYCSTEYYAQYLFDDEDKVYIYNWEDASALKFDAKWKVNKLLEELLVRFRVRASHYYVLDYLYHMIDDAKKKLWEGEKIIETYISGNYDCTFIQILAAD